MTSCIDIVANRIDHPLQLQMERVGDGLTFGISKANESPILVASRSSEEMSLGVARMGQPMSLNCSLVCVIEFNDGYEAFMVEEGVFLLSDGATLRVIKEQ